MAAKEVDGGGGVGVDGGSRILHIAIEPLDKDYGSGEDREVRSKERDDRDPPVVLSACGDRMSNHSEVQSNGETKRREQSEPMIEDRGVRKGLIKVFA